MTVDGVVVVDKPAGMTSHDVVDHVRRVFGTRKVGHAGTLDPDATGLLILGLGRATRFLEYSQAYPKRYRATAAFGVTTSSQDASGEVLSTRSCEGVDAPALSQVLLSFVGRIEQTPPMFSAVKVGGERLYRKARRGEEVARAPRQITIYELAVTSFKEGSSPEAILDVRCSAGTYVRTLVHDVGARLGCGAHLRSLRRIEAGGFVEADAVPLDRLEASSMRPLEDIVRPLERLDLPEEDVRAVAHGRSLPASPDVALGDARALFSDGRLVAVYRREGQNLRAERVVGDPSGRR
ncbi:MAG: tRNA pseudouridine(55) synthase TruB [Actinomycetota bacterium]|nr:tRNA pseudouridine(55) synthase TruB [Actinomycetota bacterium]